LEIIFTESTGLYFYSALLQANAAIIALVGLYTTFRIQSAYSNIESIKNYFLAGNQNIRDFGIEFEEKTYAEKRSYLYDMEFTNLERKQLKRWFDNLTLINTLKRGIIVPTILLAVALISDSFFLFYSTSLHQHCPNIEITWAMVNLSYEIILVIVISFKVIKLIYVKSTSD